MTTPIPRNIDLSPETTAWLERKAKSEGRAIKRQAEWIIEQARKIDEDTQRIIGNGKN